ncbi:MAG: SIR2 family protein [Bacteroidota bacterium]
MSKKKVVYLLGAGATQGELKLVDDSVQLLTSDIVSGIISKIDKKKTKVLKDLKNELNDKSDVEHLISLYESIGTNKHLKVSRELRVLFREEILERMKNFQKRNTSFFPLLTCTTIDMHQIPQFEETLSGIITVNYDSLTELAIQKVKKGINYSIKVKNKVPSFRLKKRNVFPFLKLHGSFDWKKDYPLQVTNPNDLVEEDIYCLPPGVDKKKDLYPFNLLWGKAKEILQCDLLRVIGCSLNRNDWQLISLVFSMQKIQSADRLRIEIIDFYDTGERIQKNYPYLKTKTVLDIPEFLDYLYDYTGVKRSEQLPQTAIEYVSSKNPKTNIYEWWLRAKVHQIKNSPNITSISTANNFFENFAGQIV